MAMARQFRFADPNEMGKSFKKRLAPSNWPVVEANEEISPKILKIFENSNLCSFVFVIKGKEYIIYVVPDHNLTATGCGLVLWFKQDGPWMEGSGLTFARTKEGMVLLEHFVLAFEKKLKENNEFCRKVTEALVERSGKLTIENILAEGGCGLYFILAPHVKPSIRKTHIQLMFRPIVRSNKVIEEIIERQNTVAGKYPNEFVAVQYPDDVLCVLQEELAPLAQELVASLEPEPEQVFGLPRILG